MTVIYHNNESHDVKRAIFYGCSNTAGTELADADIFNLTLEEVNSLKSKYKDDSRAWYLKLYPHMLRHSKNPVYDPSQEYNRLCNQYSFAKHITDHLEVEYENFAEPGSSNKKILFNILNHIKQGYYNPGDVVFIGATSPIRDMIIDDEGNLHNFIMAHKETLNHLSSLYEALVTVNNEYQVGLNNMLILRSIDSALRLEKIPCIFIETHPYCEHSNEIFVQKETDISLIENLKILYQDTLDRVNFLPIGTVYKYAGEKCAFGHAGPKHHKLFAKEAYEYLIRPK